MRKEATNDDTELDASREVEQSEQNSSSTLNNPNENDNQTSSEDAEEKSDSKAEQDQSEADASGQEKVLKKPDKILPCPRCCLLYTSPSPRDS